MEEWELQFNETKRRSELAVAAERRRLESELKEHRLDEQLRMEKWERQFNVGKKRNRKNGIGCESENLRVRDSGTVKKRRGNGSLLGHA
jgi:hypothetical protein